MKPIVRKCLGVVAAIAFCLAGEKAQSQDHGTSTSLGNVKVAGLDFSVTRFGEIVPGKEGALAVELATGDKKSIGQVNLYLWVEDEAGGQLSAPAKGTPEENGLHFHVTPKSSGGAPRRVTLRVRKDGLDERASLPLDGHGHEHAKTPHDGIVAALKDKGGASVGFIELKLHDDKGDLEAWLGKDQQIKEPFDVPAGTTLKVSFVDVPGKTATLAVRSKDKNEDEDGMSNLRNGKTNYFVFPGTSGQDASWLKGATFQSIVEVSVDAEGTTYKSEEFMLTPHTHGEGGHHH